MAFQFTLAAVRDHRLNLEEQRQRDLARAQGALEAARGQREQLERDVRHRHEQVRARQQHGMALPERMLIENWIVAQGQSIVAMDAQLRTLEQAVTQARGRLVEALQAREVLDQLREREWTDYRNEERRSEMKVFDEIAVREFNNTRRQEKDADQTERIAG